MGFLLSLFLKELFLFLGTHSMKLLLSFDFFILVSLKLSLFSLFLIDLLLEFLSLVFTNGLNLSENLGAEVSNCCEMIDQTNECLQEFGQSGGSRVRWDVDLENNAFFWSCFRKTRRY